MIELEIYSLDPDEIAIAERYWALDSEGNFKEKVTSLLPFRNISNSTQLSTFIKNISQAWDTNQTCPACGGHSVIRSRSEVKKSHQELRVACGECQQSAKEDQLEAAAVAEAELQRRLAPFIKHALSHTIDYSTLSDDIVLILIALERTINPRLLNGTFMRGDCRALAPYCVGDFITKLQNAHAIVDDPSKAKHGTYYLRDDQVWFKNDQAVYSLTPDRTLGGGEEAFSLFNDRHYEDHKSIRNLWLDYAGADCMCYLINQCELHKLYTLAEDDAEIRSTLRTALQTYSVAQMWSMIWMVVRDAASLSTREYYNREKASATIPGKMIRFLERTAKGTANLKQWNRPEDQPAAALGQVFIEMFGIDEDTPGTTVMTLFADEKPTSDIDFESSVSELALPAKDLLTCALAHDMGAEVMLFFADSIRSGLNVASSIQEIFSAFPMLKGSADTVNNANQTD